MPFRFRWRDDASPARAPARAARTQQRDVVPFRFEDGRAVEVLRVRDPRARRIKLSVDERGARLSLPLRASLVAGQRFLFEHREWLTAQFAAQAHAGIEPLRRGATTELPLRGDRLPLRWESARASRLEFDGDGGLLFRAPASAGDAALQRALAGFSGVGRRFQSHGDHALAGGSVRVIDDYGHQPVEIKAVLKAAREACSGRVIAIHQPHRYTRLSSLFEDFANCFNDADCIMLAPVYAAGEDPIEGVNAEALVSRIKASGHRDARYLPGPEGLAPLVAELARPGDFVVLLGAGNITQWAAALPKELEAISEGRK